MIKVLENIKALIFDCDGTLVDSMPLHFEAWEETFITYRRSYPHEFIDRHKGMTVVEVIRHCNKAPAGFYIQQDLYFFKAKALTRIFHKSRRRIYKV